MEPENERVEIGRLEIMLHFKTADCVLLFREHAIDFSLAE
jgi:hypothetical protein